MFVKIKIIITILVLLIISNTNLLAAPKTTTHFAYPADTGPPIIEIDSLSSATLAVELKMNYYRLFQQKCSRCHTPARAINSPYYDNQWYIVATKMMNKYGARLSAQDIDKIVTFLIAYCRQREDQPNSMRNVVIQKLQNNLDLLIDDQGTMLKRAIVELFDSDLQLQVYKSATTADRKKDLDKYVRQLLWALSFNIKNYNKLWNKLRKYSPVQKLLQKDPDKNIENVLRRTVNTSSTSPEHGRILYDRYCALCHGSQGQGGRGVKLNDEFLLKLFFCDKGRLRDGALYMQTLTNGRRDTLMPSFHRAKGGVLIQTQLKSIIDGLFRKQWYEPLIVTEENKTKSVCTFEVHDELSSKANTANLGENNYTEYCSKCHKYGPTAESAPYILSPDFAGFETDAQVRRTDFTKAVQLSLFNTIDNSRLREIIKHGRAEMPGFDKIIEKNTSKGNFRLQIDSIIYYLRQQAWERQFNNEESE